MDKDILKKANALNWEISSLEGTISNIDMVLVNYDQYRSNLDFRSEKHVGFSLGSKKYNFKQELKDLITKVKADLLLEKEGLEDKLRKL